MSHLNELEIKFGRRRLNFIRPANSAANFSFNLKREKTLENFKALKNIKLILLS